jgi:hypothetical protein
LDLSCCSQFVPHRFALSTFLRLSFGYTRGQQRLTLCPLRRVEIGKVQGGSSEYSLR